MTPPPDRRAYFPSIDILRGFAALSVVIYHVIALFEWTDFPVRGPLSWFRAGWMGVDLFFLISGLVIGLSAFGEMERSGPRGFGRRFMRRRFWRIAPLHYLTVAAFLVLITPAAIHDHFAANMASYVFFVHNLFPALPAINGINWTIGVEMQFYLLMIWLAPRIKGTHGLAIAGGMVLCAWAWRYGVLHHFRDLAEQRELILSTWATQLPGMLDEFALGLILARLFSHPRSMRYLLSPIGARINLALFLLLAWLASRAWVRWQDVYWDLPEMAVFFRSLLGLTFMALLAFSCSLNSPRWLKWTTPLRYLGTISYGIYLWHLLVLLLLQRIEGLQGMTAALLGVTLTLACASVSWHFIEQPLIRRFSRKRLPGEKSTHVERRLD